MKVAVFYERENAYSLLRLQFLWGVPVEYVLTGVFDPAWAAIYLLRPFFF